MGVNRIGPNRVITDDPDVTRQLLYARSGYVRGPWFDSIRTDPYVPNIVSERDIKRHDKIRAKLAPRESFTQQLGDDPVLERATTNSNMAVYGQVSCSHGRRH